MPEEDVGFVPLNRGHVSAGWVVLCLDGDGYGDYDAVPATRRLFPPGTEGRDTALAYARTCNPSRRPCVFELRQPC